MISLIRFVIVVALAASCSPDFDSLQGGLGAVGGQADDGGEETGGKIGTGGAGGQITTGTGGAGGQITTVTFAAGQGVGAMTGPGWIALGSQDTLTSSGCPTKVSGTSRCALIVWTSPNSLCASGSVPIVSGGDYADNWGIEIGVDATNPPDTQIGMAYSTIALNFTGLPTTDLSITLHRLGDMSTTTYCHSAVTSGMAYLLNSFNTQCYGTGGVQFTSTDAVKIDQVGLQATSSATGAFTLSDLCLDSIMFGL